MNQPDPVMPRPRHWPVAEILRQAFASFLAIPTVIIALFIVLAIGTYFLDRANPGWLTPTRTFWRVHIFDNPEATSSLLSTIATSIITMTSITFSLLLLALQQSAGAMTHDVFDQFLRRRLNQVYFGYFIGISLYALITLATVNPPFNPVLGATAALLLVIAALYLLLLLIYSTITQMRPTEILRSIHDHTLAARRRQQSLLAETRREPMLPAAGATLVRTRTAGYFAGFAPGDLAPPPNIEIVFHVSVGAYLATGEIFADLRGGSSAAQAALVEPVVRASRITRSRDLDTDPAYGIEQTETIAWRSISTSQQNPAPGIIAIQNLRDILGQWARADAVPTAREAGAVVYPDNVMTVLFRALESLAVVASEAMQHQTYAEVLRALTLSFDDLPAAQQARAADLVRRVLPALGDFVLTADLRDTLTALAQRLAAGGFAEPAAEVAAAHAELAASVGVLNSRATRVPPAPGT